MTLEEYNAQKSKPKSRASPKKDTPKQGTPNQNKLPDISTSEESEALSCITINSKASYAEYDLNGRRHEFTLPSGSVYQVTVKKVK